MATVLLHLSDLHTGWPFLPKVAERVVAEAHEIKPDLVVVSGDLVQRADWPPQWRAIKAILAQLPQPQLIVPGNHDVPFYNPVARFLLPTSIYRREISPDLNPVFRAPGLVVVGGNTAHGLTVDGGYLGVGQQTVLRNTFGAAAPDDLRVVVLHHHVLNPTYGAARTMIHNREIALTLLHESKVDLYLCGHIHQGFIGSLRDITLGAYPTIIAQSGTSTSSRGKGREHGRNSFNVITVEAEQFTVERRLLDPHTDRFTAAETRVFARDPVTRE